MVRTGVLGQGAVGRAVAERLRACGHEVVAADRTHRHVVLDAKPDVLLLALTHGTESEAQIAELTASPAWVVDLTTQSPDSVTGCAAKAARLGAAYHGGGLTGGPRELAAGRGVLLLGGPPEPHGPVAGIVHALGRSIDFPDARSAARAKLLHNWVLLVQQWAAALALGTVGPDGAPHLVRVLEAGTAGRPVADWSVVRDAAAPPCSTYLARLVAKDLKEITHGLPALAAAGAPVIAELERVVTADDERPYTEAFLNILEGADNGTEEAE
ncbi:hypothetical protein [Streptomyces chumphonensis]|uniref:hypothetical protein n=1 Tax=Streptomyces chumphonensis TaxID=1214925 RepID=UPI003D745446